MILNKYLSLLLSVAFYILLVLLSSSMIMIFVKSSLASYLGVILLIVFFILSRSFYNFLRNDDEFKNTKKRSSDVKGEHYIIKGEKDSKKLFIIIWVIFILFCLSIAMILFLKNKALI
ncbi:hypothetical protein [Methanobrevibacter oralis]|uniref:hypothetical protein n=1 Tax=Methanobrevibacter oralis TaxID=66851 RepID=UPI001C739958|nr:hypothetical protein [Methanobrevibacter oralis]